MVRRERRGRRSRTDADGCHAIGRLQVIDEAVDGVADANRAAEPDVRLIDHDENQPSAGGIDVGGVTGRRRRRVGLRWGDEGDPLGADDAARLAVDLDVEVHWTQSRDRLAFAVYDTDVNRGDFDAGAKDRRLRGWRLLRVQRVHRQERGERAGLDVPPDHRRRPSR